MDQVLLKLLENTGLTQKEASVYLALLELSRGTVTKIAKTTGLKRSIIYVIIEGLIKRGYASEIPSQKILSYQPADPEVLLNKLKNTAKDFSEMLPLLRTLKNKGANKPKIVYNETIEGIWTEYEKMEGAEEAFYITSYSRIEDNFPGAFKNWVKNYKKEKRPQKARHLIPDTPQEIATGKEIEKVGQEVRTLKKLIDTKLDLTLYGNKLAITSFEKDPFSVVIESDDLVNSIKPLFEIAWLAGGKIK